MDAQPLSNARPLEVLPTAWDDAVDEPFFRLTVRLLPAHLVAWGGLLLAAHDDDG